jgi:basic amino acid/polyamine antiporter, APA family
MLKRELGFNDLLYIGVGNIIGGGIFSLIGRSIKYGGGMTWMYLIVTGFVMFLMSHGYTDIMHMLKDSKSEYNIAEQFGGKYFASGYSLSSMLAGAVSGAVVALAFAEYFKSTFNVSASDVRVAFLTVIVITVINIVGVRQSADVISTLTFVEVGILVLVSLLLPKVFNKKELFKSPPNISKSILVPLIIIFAYTGSEVLPRLAGESKNPSKDIPKAINWSIISTSVLYTVVCMVIISLLGVDKSSSSKAPILDVFKKLFGNKVTVIVAIIAMASIFNTILTSNLSGSRSLYGFGKQLNISPLNKVNKKTKTPTMAILITSLISIILLLIGSKIENLAIYSNIFIMITMIMINGSAYKVSKSKLQSTRNITSMILASGFIFYAVRELIKAK